MPLMLGIDIGYKNIKVSIFEGSFGRYKLQGFRNAEIPVDERSLGERQDQALEALLKTIRQKQVQGCVLGFSSRHLSARKISLPFTDKTKISQVLPFQIEDQIPFDIDDVLLPHRVIDANKNDTELLTVIALKDKVADALAQCQDHDLDPKSLIVDADILSNLSTNENQAIIDIGYTHTICVLCQAGKVVGFQSTPVGVKNIIDELMRKQNIGQIEAEEYLFNVIVKKSSISMRNESDPHQIVLNKLNELQNTIRRTLISFEDSYELEISDVLLGGAGSGIQNIENLLTDNFGVSVEKIPLPEAMEALESDHSYIIAYLLGLKASGETHGREFDLRIDEYAYKGNLAGLGKLAKYLAVAVVLLCLTGFGMYIKAWVELNAQITTLEEEILDQANALRVEGMPEYSNPNQAIGDIRMDVDILLEKSKELNAVFQQNPPVLNLLYEISHKMPPPGEAKIDVTELTIAKIRNHDEKSFTERTTINMKARTTGLAEASKIETSLKKSPYLKNAIKKDTEKSGRFIIDIEVSNPNADEEG